MGGERVLLVSMPFGALERPALSLGLLQAHCRRLGVACDTRYLTFDFASQIGAGHYLWLCSDDLPYTAFAGDWLFTEALYGRRPFADAAYIDEILRRTWHSTEEQIARLLRIRPFVDPFLEHCLKAVPWSDYTLVGFTSVFQQNIASLALASRLKRAHPELTIAFGGANWEDAMGVALQEQFPFVDLVFSGEADESFPAVLAARRRAESPHGIPGVSATRGVAKVTPPARVQNLDNLPVPDFDAFFDQMRSSAAAEGVPPTLLMESARGCWWGERQHCTFCGLNGATMSFRSKTPARVLSEIRYLRERHDVRTFSMVDDILDMRYLSAVMPQLAEARLGIDFFWEVKANLTSTHVRQLRDAGVVFIQPGIESLSDHVLKLMRKGTTAFRNIELMKWCCEYGVKPYWNLLYGFPGETAEDYEHSLALIRAIWHLEPPTGCGPIRMDRFSPFHGDPASFGMANVRPMAPFSFLYPFDHRTLMNIAYYFDFDYTDGRADDQYARDAIALTREWMADKGRGMLAVRSDETGSLEVLDTRREFAGAPRRARLNGWKAAAYLACDQSQTVQQVCERPELQQGNVSPSDVEAFLGRCVEHQLMATNGRSWLALAVHQPARESRQGVAAASQCVTA
jgi:ribosomal peptide maturation radical SAM protein 1